MPRRIRRHVIRLITIAAGAAGAGLLLAGPAAAHVRVIADVIPGQPATLQFRVPSELAEATTVRLAIAVPPELAVTEVPPIDGWTGEIVAGTAGQHTRLVWTAQPGHEIQPAQSETFPVLVGPVPDRHSLAFDTEQTYSNGTIAAWNQEQTGAEEPPFPKPVLVINPAAKPAAGAPGSPPAEPSADPAAAPSVTVDDGEGEPAVLWVAVAGGAGLAGVLLIVLFRRRAGRAAEGS